FGPPTWPLAHWLPEGARAVVVAPHPDDEVIGFGGLLAAHARRGGSTCLLAVTDGEASHPHSRRWSESALAAERRRERCEGLSQLGLGRPDTDAAFDRDRARPSWRSEEATTDPVCTLHRCGLPDGQVERHVSELEAAIAAHLRPGDVLLTTWRLDGHPDHEATGAAVARVVARSGHRCIEAPVWMWHWARPDDPKVPWSRLAGHVLDDRAGHVKQKALAAHRTQLEAEGEGEDHGDEPWHRPGGERHSPVLGSQMVLRAARRTEWFFDNPQPTSAR
ncbi:MAG: PIG-L family deacetylase, partial [Pseudomonadota bacterium]|nr:PIG-L family deacetylase [Pseudomonadota bacterium]